MMALLRVILTLALSALTVYAGFWIVVIAILTGTESIFMLMIAVYFLVLAFFVIPITVFKVFRLKTRLMMWLGAVGIAVLSISATVAHDKYERSFEVVTTYIPVAEFRPYSAKDRAVKLDESPSFIITENYVSMDGATALYPVYAAFARTVYKQELLE